jgi:hypothetical protein
MNVRRSLFATSAYLSLAGSVYAGTPADDVQQLRNAEEVMLNKKTSSEQLAGALAPILSSHCLAVGAETGITKAARLEGTEFQTFLRDIVRSESSYYVGLESKDSRSKARIELLQRFSSRATAEEVLADWFDLGRIKMLDGEKIKTHGKFAIDDQVSARELTPGLSLDVDASKLAADIGGPGAGNGRIDNGEWANIELALINQTGVPWFSTSATAEGSGDCIFVPKQKSQIMAELALEERTSIQTWVYVSRECKTPKSTFTIVVADTWQTPDSTQKLAVDIDTVAMGTFRLKPNQVDADDPGHSDGSQGSILEPARAYEISASVHAGSSFSDASLSVGFGQHDMNFFRSTTMRSVRMHPYSVGRFSPGDDVDVTLLKRDKYRDAFIDRVDTSRWVDFGSKDSTIWIPVETTLVWTTTAAPSEESDASDEDIAPVADGETAPVVDGKDSTVESTESTEPTFSETGKVPFDLVYELFVDNLSLIPHPTETATENGILATDGYELVVDEEAILATYAAWGVHEEPAPTPAEERSLSYTYRSYFPLKIYAPPIVSGCMKKRSMSYNKEAVIDNGECEFYRRADIYADFTSVPKADNFSNLNGMPIWAPDNVSTNSYGIRAVYGHRPRVSLSVEIGAVAPDNFNEDRVLAMRRSAVNAGLGRGFRVDKPLEFEVMGQIGLNKYEMLGMLNAGQPDSVLEPASARNLTYGLASRALLSFNPALGSYVGMHYTSGSPLSIRSKDPTLNHNSALGVVADEFRTGFELGFSYHF